jgi:hypothetical protein
MMIFYAYHTHKLIEFTKNLEINPYLLFQANSIDI